MQQSQSPWKKLFHLILSAISNDQDVSKESDHHEKSDSRDEESVDQSSKTHELEELIIKKARSLIGLPYHHAGTSPSTGFDCSGLVHYVFSAHSIDIPRTSQQQSEAGTSINPNEAQIGDLVFFSHSGDRINHVGIVTSQPGEQLRMIHASSSKGVIQTTVTGSEYWEPRMRGVKRLR